MGNHERCPVEACRSSTTTIALDFAIGMHKALRRERMGGKRFVIGETVYGQ
jgi:hypothetical protein